MGSVSESSLAMLDKALEMERNGKDFYAKAAAACLNEVGREVFETLRRDEDVHIARIVEIYGALNKGGAWTADWKARKFSHGDLAAFFAGLARKYHGTAAADAGDIQALDVGIDFELKSVAFYEHALTSAKDAFEREFVDRMIVEERSHHTILEDARLYLTDPSSWFREQERSGLDGA